MTSRPTRRQAAATLLTAPAMILGTRAASAQGVSTQPSAAAPTAGSSQVTEDLARAIGLEAYTYFYPLITMELTRQQATNYARLGEHFGRGPANTFVHIREFPPADFRDVVRPNFDTLYSAAWLDLTREPMVLSLPETDGPQGRYYLMPMLDMWTNVFASPGTRTTGTGGGHFAILPPGWSGNLPTGVTPIAAPTPRVWVIGRTQTDGLGDYATVHRQQDGYRLSPLSRWGQPPAAVTGTVNPDVDMRTPPSEQVNRMRPAQYFALGAELLKTNPPGAYDQPILARMARIGLRPGASFDMTAAPPAVRAGLERAGAEGVRHLARSMPNLGAVKNGWLYLANDMGVYGTDYLRRAVVAMAGLGANVPEDAIYPLTQVSGDGRALTGQNRYLLRFPRGQEPPVGAFWSVTLYDAQGFQVANPINRFAIGDRDSLVRAADGAIELLIQHDDPGEAQRPNWLPAPEGPFNLTLRLYDPLAPALDGRWVPPPVQFAEAPRDAPGAMRIP